jgi:8-oxo-dGTP pyrophosphatase MutT (NUDIX family)
LKREIEEECGLLIIKGELIYTRIDNDMKTYTYLCEVEGEVKTSESGIVKEVTWDELFEGTFGDYNRGLYNTISKNQILWQ